MCDPVPSLNFPFGLSEFGENKIYFPFTTYWFFFLYIFSFAFKCYVCFMLTEFIESYCVFKESNYKAHLKTTFPQVNTLNKKSTGILIKEMESVNFSILFFPHYLQCLYKHSFRTFFENHCHWQIHEYFSLGFCPMF